MIPIHAGPSIKAAQNSNLQRHLSVSIFFDPLQQIHALVKFICSSKHMKSYLSFPQMILISAGQNIKATKNYNLQRYLLDSLQRIHALVKFICSSKHMKSYPSFLKMIPINAGQNIKATQNYNLQQYLFVLNFFDPLQRIRTLVEFTCSSKQVNSYPSFQFISLHKGIKQFLQQ